MTELSKIEILRVLLSYLFFIYFIILRTNVIRLILMNNPLARDSYQTRSFLSAPPFLFISHLQDFIVVNSMIPYMEHQTSEELL